MYQSNFKLIFFLLSFVLAVASASAQTVQKIGTNPMTLKPAAVLELESTSKGFLPPRMTSAQRNAIVSPPAGLMIYCSDCATTGEPQFYNGIQWMSMSSLNANTATSSTGKTWMDRNLGASQVATSSTDALGYGYLYQWGRGNDGHQMRASLTTTTLSTSDTPGNGDFIVGNNVPYDWRSGQNANLWQGVNGMNNPCPSGFRLPTFAELDAERANFSSQNAAGAFAALKLPMAGLRLYGNGSISNGGSAGRYWSSTVSATEASYLSFNTTASNTYTVSRAYGFAVRCLKD